MPRLATRMQRADLIPLDVVRNRLAAVWLGGAAIIFTLLVVQSLLGRYEDKTQDAWGWLLPTLMPSLGMIITVLSYTALEPKLSKSVVKKTFARLSLWLSGMYLALILLTILLQPFAAADPAKAVALMHTSNLWLGPIQGLVASALGVLFVSRKDTAAGEALPARTS